MTQIVDGYDRAILEQIYDAAYFAKSDLSKIFDQHARQEIPRGKKLLDFGEVASAYYVVEEGMLRNYVIDFQREEITTEFFVKGDIAIEVVSLFKGLPSESCIHALTDCVVWRINSIDFQNLFFNLPGFPDWGRNWMTEQLFSAKTRHIRMITEDAATRYAALAAAKPEVAMEAPLKYIASYLGIANTSLSRLRRQKTTKPKKV